MITILEDVTCYEKGAILNYQSAVFEVTPVSDDEPADSIAIEIPVMDLRLVMRTSELELAIDTAKREARRK